MSECPMCGSIIRTERASDTVQIVISGPKKYRQQIVDRVHEVLMEEDLIGIVHQGVDLRITSTLEPSEEVWG